MLCAYIVVGSLSAEVALAAGTDDAAEDAGEEALDHGCQRIRPRLKATTVVVVARRAARIGFTGSF